MLIPFDSETFQQQMKPLLSMAHLSLEYENVESTLAKVCTEMSDRLGEATYAQVLALGGATDAETPAVEALDYLRRAVLHFGLYHHIIYTIANISNDGVTVTKSDDKTTIYKYQQDQLEEQLVGDAWFWLNRLIAHLDAHTDLFTAWATSDEHDALASLPVTTADFERYGGVSDATFLLYAQGIVREVVRECVWSRQSRDMALTEAERAAVCYDVMARACSRLSWYALPAPVRIDINNEMGKNHAEDADRYVRTRVAQQYTDKAAAYWQQVDAAFRAAAEADRPAYRRQRPVREGDKFCVS